jgi:Stage II sporulation protein
VVIATLPLAGSASAGVDDWQFDGGGWGHGVGLSQFGALGQAQDGRSASQILSFYYKGTSIATPLPSGHWTTEPNGLWLGLVSSTTAVSISAVGGPLTICQPSADCSHVSQPIASGEIWTFEVNSANEAECRFRLDGISNTGWAACDASISGLTPASRAKVSGKEYAHGIVRLTPSSAGFHVVLTTDLETYLYGLAEVPSSWPAEALKSQAIIGRSYAVATAVERGGSDGSGKLASCGCHLLITTADQAYSGWSKENPANGGAPWVTAVNGTAGKLLTHPSSNYPFDIAKAFYSSSNGGWSENVEDVWGGSALQWLRAVKDKWSSDPSVNPLAHWTILVNTANVAKYLGWDKVYTGILLNGPPGAVVRFSGKKAGSPVTVDLNGTQVRSLLNTYGFRTDGQAVRVSPYISAVTDPPGFNDIDGDIFENAIKWLALEGITEGCNPPTNTNYCPDQRVTRGEMAVFISRVLNLPAPLADHFTDDTGAFYEGAANRIFEAGITVGCGDHRYCGEKQLPRDQMAALLARTLKLSNTSTDYFVDDTGSQFESAINKIAAAKITLGCNPPVNDRYCPSQYVTRGQMAAFFKRAWGS